MSKYRVVFERSVSQWAEIEVEAPDEATARTNAEQAYDSGELYLDWEYDTGDDGIVSVEQV